MKSFILLTPIPRGCDSLPELQFCLYVILHGLIDDGFDAAPFRFHVIYRDAIGGSICNAPTGKLGSAFMAAFLVGLSHILLNPVLKEIYAASTHGQSFM
jgi:hypothetical protein